MLKVENVKKTFNKGKKNQVNAIDDTSLIFGANGLVALLGVSGCGKTTLLNAMGGLDSVDSGRIYIDDYSVTSKNGYNVDKVRNLKIGYIFQDYKLIDNISVFDNVAMSLKLIGVKDSKEIKKRCEYVLDKVGMLRYKKRPAGMLSGGERQRVGIARAIVKNPDIILADEPTGNLDSKNSLEIMRIIKAISKEKLVILVTHEEALAKFYATRIVEIVDGKVLDDYASSFDETLDYQLDNTFYLKDFNEQAVASFNQYNLNIYSNNREKLDLDIVINGKNVYIKSNNDDNVEVLDSNSSIEFVNDNYKKIDRRADYQYDFSMIMNNNDEVHKYSSILNIFKVFIDGFKKVFSYPLMKKVLLLGFLISSIFLVYAAATFAGTLTFNDKDFIKYNKNYISVSQKKVTVDIYNQITSLDSVSYAISGNSLVDFYLEYDGYYQTNNIVSNISGSVVDVSKLDSSQLICGNMPTSMYEVVVDKMVIDSLVKNYDYNRIYLGMSDYSDFLDKKIYIEDMDKLKIVGISSSVSPSIYIDSSLFTNILLNSSSDIDNDEVFDYLLYKDKLSLVKGSFPNNDYDVIVPIEMEYEYPINKEIDVKINGKRLKVVGYYSSRYGYDYYFTTNNTMKYKLITNKSNLMVYANDKKKAMKDLKNININSKDSYVKSKNEYINSRKNEINNAILISIVIVIISLVEIILIMRSSFLSRIKEVGVYRAIGVKKSDIIMMFFGEIFAITSLTAVPGILFTSYFVKYLSRVEDASFLGIEFGNYLRINFGMVLMLLIFVYLFNIVMGLIPVFTTLLKPPAAILSREDLE